MEFLTGFSGLHQVEKHVVDTSSLCQHQRLEQNKQCKFIEPINTNEYLRSYSSLSAVQPYLQQLLIAVDIQEQKQHLNCVKSYLNMNILKHSLQHGHSRARRQPCALCLEKNKKNRKWLLAIATTKETGNRQL